MTMTKEDLQRRFDEYNQLYFDGKLKRAKLGFLSKNFKHLLAYLNLK